MKRAQVGWSCARLERLGRAIRGKSSGAHASIKTEIIRQMYAEWRTHGSSVCSAGDFAASTVCKVRLRRFTTCAHGRMPNRRARAWTGLPVVRRDESSYFGSVDCSDRAYERSVVFTDRNQPGVDRSKDSSE